MASEKINSDLYKTVIKLSYSEISKYVHNSEDIKELAHTVAIKYFFNKAQIKDKNNWIFTTAKNAAINFNEKNKNDILRNSKRFDNLENLITKDILENKPTRETEKILKEAESILSIQERDLLELYLKGGRKLKEFSRRQNIGYQSLKKKLYRLKKDIKAEYNKKKGMIATKEIVGAHLHENIIYFIKQFQNALQENSLERMKFYLRGCRIPSKIPNINIKEIIQYEVILVGKNKYKLIVHFLNGNGRFSAFNTTFEIYNKNSIRILDFPKNPSRIISISADEGKKIDDRIEVDKNGMLKMNREEFDKMLSEKNVKTETIYENEE